MGRPDLEKMRLKHRRWLAGLGLLDRPWLILGSAPNPTIPRPLVERAARVDINNAGKTATALGLGRADLTVRTHGKPWVEYPDLDTRALLWIHPRPWPVMWWEMFRQSNAKVGSLRRWTRKEREAIVEHVSGAPLAGVGRWGKATTGIAAACYGIFCGVPQVVLAGISLNTPGHSYDTRERPRAQTDEDAFVLQCIRGRPELFTTEPVLADGAGVKRWTDE